MPKITDYLILEFNTKFDLIENVKSYMKDGWQPLGGHQQLIYPNEDLQPYWAQTIVRYDS